MSDRPSILAYGDSLTWGARPDGLGRHGAADRWPNVLAAQTGFEVIAEGLRGRTTAFEGNPSPAEMNGAVMLPSILHSHVPLDGVILMLGTNDIWCDLRPDHAVRGLKRCIEIVQTHPARIVGPPPPRVMILAPPPMVLGGDPDVTERHVAACRELAPRYQDLAIEMGAGFFDTADVATASTEDSIHLDAVDTRAIGLALAEPVRAWIAG